MSNGFTKIVSAIFVLIVIFIYLIILTNWIISNNYEFFLIPRNVTNHSPHSNYSNPDIPPFFLVTYEIYENEISNMLKYCTIMVYAKYVQEILSLHPKRTKNISDAILIIGLIIIN